MLAVPLRCPFVATTVKSNSCGSSSERENVSTPPAPAPGITSLVPSGFRHVLLPCPARPELPEDRSMHSHTYPMSGGSSGPTSGSIVPAAAFRTSCAEAPPKERWLPPLIPTTSGDEIALTSSVTALLSTVLEGASQRSVIALLPP